MTNNQTQPREMQRKSVTVQAAADLLDVPYGTVKDAHDFGLIDGFYSGETGRYLRIYIDSVRTVEKDRETFIADVDQKRLDRQKARMPKQAPAEAPVKENEGIPPAVIEQGFRDVTTALSLVNGTLTDKWETMLSSMARTRQQANEAVKRVDQVENTLLDSINVVLQYAKDATDRIRDLEVQNTELRVHLFDRLDKIAGAQNALYSSLGMIRQSVPPIAPIKAGRPWADGPAEGEGTLTGFTAKYMTEPNETKE